MAASTVGPVPGGSAPAPGAPSPVPETPLLVRVVTGAAAVMTFLSFALWAFLSAVLDRAWAWDVLVTTWILTLVALGAVVAVHLAWRRGNRPGRTLWPRDGHAGGAPGRTRP